MDLILQCGHGMMQLCRDLIKRWGGGTAILSPRDSTANQLENLATDVKREPNGEVLLDPQLYLPHADHAKLCAHEYWPSDYDTSNFLTGTGVSKLMRSLLALNQQLGCQEFIVPGFHATSIDDDWLATQQSFLEAANALNSKIPLRATIALTSDALKAEDGLENLLERASKWKIEAYYVVCEHPPMQYLVEDPVWATNLIDLCAGLKLLGKHVLLGYANQQMLLAAAAKVDAVASGTWMNVRSFNPEKFNEDVGDIKRKSVWYYCPHALTEYKSPSLDIAKKLGLLSEMAPEKEVNGHDTDTAFRGPSAPSTVLTEPIVFRHYLHALRAQAVIATKSTFDETCEHHDYLLETAANFLKRFSARGIRGEVRDFGPAIDANKQALEVLKHTRGGILRRKWHDL